MDTSRDTVDRGGPRRRGAPFALTRNSPASRSTRRHAKNQIQQTHPSTEPVAATINPSAHLVDDLDLDSLDVISLVQVIGDAVGVGMEEDDVRGCTTLGDLAERVAARVSASA